MAVPTESQRPPAPLSVRLNRYFMHRSERERSLFETVRRTLSFRTILIRRAAAKRIAASASFSIDRTRGFAVFSPDRFPEALEIVAATHGVADRVDLGRPGLSKKARAGFMVPMLDTAALDVTSPFLRLALRPDIIAAVSAYLGMVPVIAHLQVYYSGAGEDEARRQSQLFHCDSDDTTQVKIFVLCTAVSADNGPLTLLEAGTSQALRQRLDYQFGKKIKDKQLEGVITEGDRRPVVGPAGTVCFADTSRCFHFGSRVEKEAGPRLIAMVQYLTPSAFMLPRGYRADAPFRHLAVAGLSRDQRLVLGVD